MLTIRADPCELDFLALGAVVHRLDPGILPFRRARALEVHVSGGEYNVAANLASCFGRQTAIATAMVNNGIGELVQARIREMGVQPFFKHFEHDGVRAPQALEPLPGDLPQHADRQTRTREGVTTDQRVGQAHHQMDGHRQDDPADRW